MIAEQPAKAMLSVRQGQAGFFSEKRLEDTQEFCGRQGRKLREICLDAPAHPFGKTVLSLLSSAGLCRRAVRGNVSLPINLV